MVTRIEIGTRPGFADSRGAAVARRIRDHLGLGVAAVRTRDVYHVEPSLSREEAQTVADAFAGPVLRRGSVGRIEGKQFDVVVSVGYKPGVTDPVGKSARVAIEDLLGRSLGPGGTVYSSRMYLLEGVDLEAGRRIARELLANELIERVEVLSRDEWLAAGPDLRVPSVAASVPPAIETIDLEIEDSGLERLSRERLLALSLEEMLAVREHFRAAASSPARRAAGLGAEPTDVELECIAQTWSEHCKHKIINATIVYRENGGEPQRIDSLFKRFIRGTTERIDSDIRARDDGTSWLVSVFHDNAGVIAATDQYHLVYKVETHNSPSALDPYGGAITGIVGVNRDPFGTGLGAELLSNTWGYCFAPPDYQGQIPAGLLHPRRVRDGVHHGVIDGGNQSGIPYGRGWEFFDDRFLGKPLVYCGTVARMPREVVGNAGHVKRAAPGDRIVMVGGRIGKDGIHGATFSSAELTEESPVQAVQIGDPITQKMMFDFLIEARDLGLYSAITDNGAGGLSSSVGEMAEIPGGARLELGKAPLKYQGLAPWEILLSEAQERMTLAVPAESLDRLLELARRREVEATEMGEFTDDGTFHVLYEGRTVALLPLAFLHDGLPMMSIAAEWDPPAEAAAAPAAPPAGGAEGAELAEHFLSRHNIASIEQRCREYDHEVKGLTIVKPWTGVLRDVPSDASVFQIDHDTWAGYAVAEGVFPRYSDVDAHAMAQAAVDLTVRRLIASGARADRIAALDNYCWPDPLPGPANPDASLKAAHLVRASRGLAEACVAYGVPLISGKDSMKNDAVIGGRRISIPPTLLVSGIALLDDVRCAITLQAGGAGQLLLIVGETSEELGASEWLEQRGASSTSVPRCRPEQWVSRYRAVESAIRDGLVTAAHAPALGGLLPSLFRMARATGGGLTVDLGGAPSLEGTTWEGLLFGESCGRLLLACRVEDEAALTGVLAGHPFARIGNFTDDGILRVAHGSALLLEAGVERLAAAWKRERDPEEGA
jgi:phosphoribosylformylglycinamidine synthase